LVAPHLVEEAVPGDHLTTMLQEITEEIELLARQPHLTPRAKGLAAAQVDPRVAERELLELLPRPRAPQHRADTGQKLTEAEGLGHVVVGAQLEPAHAIDLLAARGEHDHGNIE